MMKLLLDWGLTRAGWRSGERGEYLVLLQGSLLNRLSLHKLTQIENRHI